MFYKPVDSLETDTDSKNTSYYVSVIAYNVSQPTPGYANALSRHVDIANNTIIVKYLFKKMSYIDDRKNSPNTLLNIVPNDIFGRDTIL